VLDQHEFFAVLTKLGEPSRLAPARREHVVPELSAVPLHDGLAERLASIDHQLGVLRRDLASSIEHGHSASIAVQALTERLKTRKWFQR
jgi:hypothetical protein